MMILTVQAYRRGEKGCRLLCATLGDCEVHRDLVNTDSAFERSRFLASVEEKTRERYDCDIAVAELDDKIVAAAEQADEETLAADGAPLCDPVVVCLADVQQEEIRWLWPGRIALGKLTLISGDPGLGKSFTTCDLAARVSLGSKCPDCEEYFPQGSVVLLNAEDELSDTVRPRLEAAGANLGRITALTAVRTFGEKEHEHLFDLQADLPALELAIAQRDDCRLVIIDPISAYLGKCDGNSNSDIRGVLKPLAELAAKHRVAIVMVSHLNKGMGPAMYRTMGSLAFVAAARAVWSIVKDRDDPRRRLFLPVKNNIAKDATGLTFEIIDGVVAWDPKPLTMTADDAMAPTKGRPGPDAKQRDEAVEFLRETLADGPRPAKEVEKEAREVHGIAERTYFRARRQLDVEAFRDGKGPWMLRLPTEPIEFWPD